MVAKLKRLSDRDENLVLFFNPMSKWQKAQLSRTNNLQPYNEWKKEISKIGHVIQFEERWPELNDPNNWEDLNHFTPNISATILHDLVLHTQCKPLKFGHYDSKGKLFQRRCL